MDRDVLFSPTGRGELSANAQPFQFLLNFPGLIDGALKRIGQHLHARIRAVSLERGNLDVRSMQRCLTEFRLVKKLVDP